MTVFKRDLLRITWQQHGQAIANLLREASADLDWHGIDDMERDRKEGEVIQHLRQFTLK